MTTVRTLLLIVGLMGLGAGLAQDVGEATFQTNCAACHQANGQGVPSAFPPLAGHVPELLSIDGGRTYLIRLLLNGLQGQITVLDQTYDGVMPAWPHLSDEQIAAVLSYVATAWENEMALPEGFEPFHADEVAAERGHDVSASDIHQQRQELLADD